jgi:Flp pilus assembly protein TadG
MKRIVRNRRGAALLELALVAVAMSIIVVGAIDFGRVAYMAMALTNASRAGAMYGSQPTKSADTVGMRIAAAGSASNDIGSIKVTASRVCECGNGTDTTATVIVCGAACGGVTRVRVRVIATDTFKLVRPFPGLRNNVVINRTAIMRAQ